MRLALLLTLLASTAVAADLPVWLKGREADAAWLQGGTKETPRALIEISDSDVEVILWIPETTPDQIVRNVYNYDVYKRTKTVETSFEADGVFFTGTRVLGNFSPTVTNNRKVLGDGTLTISWTLMPLEQAKAWVTDHRSHVETAVQKAGLDVSVDDYMQEILERVDTIASVEGAHDFDHGWYRYRQVIAPRNQAVAGIVNALGKGPQLSAALKAACYSTGNHTWAGPSGSKGVEFEVRGYTDGLVRPGK